MTFNPAGDVKISIVILLADVASEQQSALVERLSCLLRLVEVTHEHVSTIHTHLPTIEDLNAKLVNEMVTLWKADGSNRSHKR